MHRGTPTDRILRQSVQKGTPYPTAFVFFFYIWAYGNESMFAKIMCFRAEDFVCGCTNSGFSPCFELFNFWAQNSSVGKVTRLHGCRTDESRKQRADRLWGFIQLQPMGTGVSVRGGEAAGHEADHSPPYSVKNTRSLIKSTDNFIF
jgi:hypothetical protein